ncbi:HET domain-protein, partial [Cladorrhinum samala]
WVDTCCIDKTSSAELTEAINSMYMWYANSTVCYAWLSDLEPSPDGDNSSNGGWRSPAKGTSDSGLSEHHENGDHDKTKRFENCRWFTRGWTLQELIAPRRLGFYDRHWKFQGQKSDLSGVLATITGISKEVLIDEAMLPTVSVACRMSWASKRQTTRIEDMAYCLLGIFGVQLPLLYGEGENAFIRLQEEIIKESNDLSLFAWRVDSKAAKRQKHWGILARSPKDFVDCSDIVLWVDPIHNSECSVTSKGLRVTPVPRCGLRLGEKGSYVFNLQCRRGNRTENLGVLIQQHGSDVYTRVRADQWSAVPRSDNDKMRPFFVTKTVSPVRSAVLSTSHRDAINLSRALTALSEYGVELAGPGAFTPAGHWDSQRSLFLTCGMNSFPCCVHLRAGNDTFVLGCLLVQGSDLVARFYSRVDGDAENLSRINPAHGYDRRTIDIWKGPQEKEKLTLRVRVVKEMMGGQPVSVVVIETVKHVSDPRWDMEGSYR